MSQHFGKSILKWSVLKFRRRATYSKIVSKIHKNIRRFKINLSPNKLGSHSNNTPKLRKIPKRIIAQKKELRIRKWVP